MKDSSTPLRDCQCATRIGGDSLFKTNGLSTLSVYDVDQYFRSSGPPADHAATTRQISLSGEMETNEEVHRWIRCALIKQTSILRSKDWDSKTEEQASSQFEEL